VAPSAPAGASGVTGETGSGTSTAIATPGSSTAPGATAPDTSEPVQIGIRYLADTAGLIAAMGVEGFSAFDHRAMAQVMVDHVNATGGLAGHPIEPIYHAYDASRVGQGDVQEQAACSAFTEDASVTAVISPFFSGAVLQQCLADAGVFFVDSNYGLFDMARIGQRYFVPDHPDEVRVDAVFVDRLVAAGFFADGARIGLIRDEGPRYDRVVDQGLAPALARHGLAVDEVLVYSANNPSSLSSGLLRFQASGVTNVFILEVGGLVSTVLMSEAEGQGYRPRYALDTRNFPYLLETNAPAEQLRGALGIGWHPTYDIGPRAAAEAGPVEHACVEVMRQGGQEPRDAGMLRFAYSYCGVFSFLQTAASRIGGVQPDQLTTGAESFGDAFHPVGVFAGRFGPGRHDGTSAVRPLAYDEACGCFQYDGPVIPIG
jgi:hypothetical protein